ncbi:MAG: UDP-3-O-(3-hydroxymyristoyl)glucosamine N-acyltransferase [Candidatus Omnitrophota bacterium]
MTPTPAKRNKEGEKNYSLSEIAALVGGRVCGDPAVRITGIGGIKEAKEGDITFLQDKRYLPLLSDTGASAVLVGPEIRESGKPLVQVQNPSQAFSVLSEYFHPSRTAVCGVHSTAVIEKKARIGSDVTIGPHAVIEDEASIGDRARIGANSFVGAGCRIGADVLIYPNVVIREDCVIGERTIIHSGSVIGSDGFGYETTGGVHKKIPQIGNVVIEEDVEVGANVCIDRGRFSKTWIQKGTKIDNLVQIAHNVVIGPHSMIVSQVGISGSTELGHHVVIAGQAGITGHLAIGDESIIGAQAGVNKSLPPKSVVLGSPAKPIGEQKRLFAYINRLPDLFKDVLENKKNSKGKGSAADLG